MGWGLAGRLGPDHGDPVFYVYLLKWVASRLPHGLGGLWDPPFFHPMEGVLALSDHFVGPGVAFALLRALGLPALAAYNLLYASAFVLAGVACWWVLRRSGLSFWAAVLGGGFFAFAHYRWDEQSHFNVLRIAWIPLVLWTFDRLLAAPTAKRAAAFALCYAAHLAGSVYLAYLVHLPLALLAWNRRRELAALRADPRRALPLAAAAATAMALLALLWAGYSGRIESLNAERSIGELRKNAPLLASFKGVSAHAPIERLLPILRAPQPRGALFPGFVVASLAGVSLADGWRRHRRPAARPLDAVVLAASAAGLLLVAAALAAQDLFSMTGERRLLGVELHGYRLPLVAGAAGVALVVAAQRRLRAGAILGPAFHGWRRGLLLAGLFSLAACLPAPFWLLWEHLPGMDGMRIPHRFYPFAAVAVALAAGRGLDRLRWAARSRAARAAIAAGALALLAFEQAPALRAWTPFPDEPEFAAYARYLRDEPSVRAYVELPMFGDWHDLTTMYLGSLHWKPLVNGSSSFLPHDREELARTCTRLEEACLEQLHGWGVTHLVSRFWLGEDVRGKRRRRADRETYFSWEPRLEELVAAGRLAPVFRRDGATVYRFAGVAGGGPAPP